MPEQKPEPHFETRAERRARKRLDRKQGPTRKKFSAKLLWTVVGALAIGGGVWWLVQSGAGTPKDPATVASEHKKLLDRCTTDMATTFHIHPHLRIIINGDEQQIPTNTGIDSGCMHSLHAHDSTGIIHVESPKKADFTLADFFYTWKKEYSAIKILDQTLTAESQLKLFVDGKEVTTGPNTVMQDKTSYVIMYGSAGTELKPPTNYDKFPD